MSTTNRFRISYVADNDQPSCKQEWKVGQKMYGDIVAVCCLCFLLMPSVSFGVMMDVSVLGKKAGVLDVDTYTGGKTADGTGVTADITANFTKTGIAPGAEDLLKMWFPQGLTYMQTLMFMTDKQQKIFRSGAGKDLKDTFSDPPQGGYTIPGGGKQFAGDKTPWYSVIEPTMVAGDVPPKPFRGGTKQFADSPTIPFADFADGTEGLAKVLNGKDGMLNFETALVGVKEKPTDDPATPEDERLTGTYKVVVLKTFTWGLNFKFMDDMMNGITGDDYIVTKKDLMFGLGASDAFKGAFDKLGDNKDIEWKVDVVKHVPEPTTLFLLAFGLVVLIGFKRKTPSNLTPHKPNELRLFVARSRDKKLR